MGQINLSAFPKFGTLTSGGGLAAVFDPVGQTTQGHATSTTGYAGFDCQADPQAIDKIVVTCADNGWDGSGAEGGQVRFFLYGKKVGGPDVLLGTAGPIRDYNQTLEHTVYSSDWFTKWDYIWVWSATPTWVVLSDFKAYSPEIPQIGSGRRYLRRVSNSSQPISKNGTFISGLRFLFELTQSAAVKPDIKIEIEHMAWATGIGELLSCGCYLKHRQASTLADLSTAPYFLTGSYQIIDRAGRNLSTETHYERQLVRDAIQLGPGFHEIIPWLNSNTYLSSADYYSGVLVEYGKGLNKGIVTIDPSGEVINL